MLPEQLQLTDGTIVRLCPTDKPLYCSRDGRFFSVHNAVLTDDGWILHQLKPHWTLAMANHKRGSCYPSMRRFGLCHHLIIHAWHGARPAGKECDHLNGNKLDWCADNLQWVTSAENRRRAKLMRRMRNIGLQPKWLYYGTLRGLYSLPTEQAELIINRFRFEAGTSDDAITTERINSTFAFLLDELKSEQS